MTTTTLASTQPASTVVSAIDSELRLRLLSAVDNPLPSGGSLTLIVSSASQPQRILEPCCLTCDTGPVSLGLSPTLTLMLESSGLHLLRLELEVVPITDALQERIEVIVRSQGIDTKDAEALLIGAQAYTWRLSGRAAQPTRAGTESLVFELVQELEPTAPFDPLASVRLPFGELTSGDHQARMKVKRSGMGPVVSP